MERLLSEQEDHIHAITRTKDNFKKLGQKNYSPAIVRNRLSILQDYWTKCQRSHEDIKAAASTLERTSLAYFTEGQFLKAEEAYMDASDFLAETLDKLIKPISQAASNINSSSISECNAQAIPLPRINLPKFSGLYTEWSNFKDLFVSLVASNESLSNVQRMHYLKASLTGEAGLVIKNIAVNDANYSTAWSELTNRYENLRAIVTAHLHEIFDLQAMKTESASELRRILDTTNDAINALKNLGRSTSDDFVVATVVRKLDARSLREWELSIGNSYDPPTFAELSKFLACKLRALEAISDARDKSACKNNRVNSTKSLVSSVAKHKCPSCNEAHYLYQCTDFKNLSVDKRKAIVKEHRCCFNCMGKGHVTRNCPSHKRCQHCQNKHHTLLHETHECSKAKVKDSKDESDNADVMVSVDNSKATHSFNVLANHSYPDSFPVLLATARILVRSNEGRSIRLRALIDPGSEATFITERAAQLLFAKRKRTCVRVTGVGGRESSISNASITVELSSEKENSVSIPANALILPKLTSYNRSPKFKCGKVPHLRNLDFADPDMSSRDNIEMLIGADIYGSILLEGLRKGAQSEPVAQRTIFGWVVLGPYLKSPVSSQDCHKVTTLTTSLHTTLIPSLDDSLKRFWELEELPSIEPFSEEEKLCEAIFVSTYKRTSEGRYMVRLPFKRDVKFCLGNSLKIASKLYSKLESRLAKDFNLSEGYRCFLNEYESLGHMAPVNHSEIDNIPAYYLPHHPVVRPTSSTSPLRVVFNASCVTDRGISLNDLLLTGAKLQADLPSLLMRWRTHRLVFIADIAKMFRQVLVHPADTDFQRILWRHSPDLSVSHYRLLTVTYGTAPAPFLAMRVLKQLCHDEGSKYPLAVSILENSIYVDDVLFGAHEVSTIQETRYQLTSLLLKGGFHLRKWATNYDELLHTIPLRDRLDTSQVSFQEDSAIKALGLYWNHESDCFTFHNQITLTSDVTKRSVLSAISRIFDPLGLIAPITIRAKIMMQELWLRKVDWDAPLPPDIRDRWDCYYSGLLSLKEISIPRWTSRCPNDLGIELHGFADASNRAYAAVIYSRVISASNEYSVSLLLSKTKVAPIKTVSIPRLELCAAVLLSRLSKLVRNALQIEAAPVYCWSDSSVTLAWIQQHPSCWKTFVANRVSQIQSLLPNAKWRYVSSKFNPADCASRGIDSSLLKDHPLWWKGPPWLSKHATSWPESLTILLDDDSERRTTLVHLAVGDSAEWSLPNEVSSWPRLLRITAYCMLFIDNLKRVSRKSNAINLFVPTSSPITLTVYIKRAHLFWMRLVQKSNFHSEIQQLRKGGSISTNSKLKGLNPFVDGEGLLRVGGRLDRSSLSFAEKHPLILPRHRISELIIDQTHKRCLHGGPQMTLRVLRQDFWILNSRRLVKLLIHKCVTCARYRANPVTQLMGDLPSERVSPSRPFQHVGIDYAGPFLVLNAVGRGQRTHKTYIALFVCLSTRAIHLELVNDYTTDGFIAAFKRFSARRGLPTVLYSDNATNFQGAERALTLSFKALCKDRDLMALLASDGITWKFIPPSAPHFGGIWEAGVKSVKYHLKRIVGPHTLSNEEFSTLLAQIEACLNSRSISALSDDPNDLSPLTPGHFLVGGPLIAVPEESVLDLKESRLNRWQHLRRMHEQFWRVWTKDYLHSLQQRSKWRQRCSNLAYGELVVVRDDLLPPSRWKLGRVVKVYPDLKGDVRVADVRTANGVYQRPITKLCRLPVDSIADAIVKT